MDLVVINLISEALSNTETDIKHLLQHAQFKLVLQKNKPSTKSKYKLILIQFTSSDLSCHSSVSKNNDFKNGKFKINSRENDGIEVSFLSSHSP